MASRGRWLVEVVGISALAVAAYFVIPLDGEPAVWLAALVVVGVVAAMLPLAIKRAGHVLTAEDPLAVALASLIQLVTMLVVSFATVYFVLGTRYADQMSGVSTKVDALYFTVVTMGTVGYGDVVATGQTARAIVTTNILANVALLAVALRVVSWAWRQRSGEETLRAHAERRSAAEPRSWRRGRQPEP